MANRSKFPMFSIVMHYYNANQSTLVNTTGIKEYHCKIHAHFSLISGNRYWFYSYLVEKFDGNQMMGDILLMMGGIYSFDRYLFLPKSIWNGCHQKSLVFEWMPPKKLLFHLWITLEVSPHIPNSTWFLRLMTVQLMVLNTMIIDVES